jgi:xanthine dehydrogenase accessory factor
MIQDVLTFAQANAAQGKKVALITVIETTGSSPASVGQLMAVLADGTSAGTLGGGTTEYQIIQKTIAAINNGEKVFSFNLDHTESGMLCGGSMSGYGTIVGEESHLFIFGGGYIAQSLAPLAAQTGFCITVVEDRCEFAGKFSGIRYLVCKPEDYEKNIQLPDSAYVVICTRGHTTDNEVLRFCLPRQGLKYLGMIGSKKKAKALLEKLLQDGYCENVINNISTPIGLDIASSVPQEIAISIMAEILLVKNNGSLSHKKGNT